MTTTWRGDRIGASEATDAVQSRPSERSSSNDSSVRSSSTCTWPPSYQDRITRPTDRNTSSMASLPASVSATSMVIPARTAISAKSSSSRVPIPSCWWLSATANATSASDRSGTRMYSPMATTASASRAMSTTRRLMS